MSNEINSKNGLRINFSQPVSGITNTMLINNDNTLVTEGQIYRELTAKTDNSVFIAYTASTATATTNNFVNVSGDTMTGGLVTPTLSATTISATTYLGLPTDINVTGGTYSNGTATFTNNTGGTFNVTGLTSPQALTDTRIAFGSATNLVTESTGLTFNDSTKVLNVGGNIRSTKAAGGNGFEIHGGSWATSPTSLTIDAVGTTAFLKVNGVNHMAWGGGGISLYGYLFPDIPNTRQIGAPTYAFTGIHGTAFRSPIGLDRLWDIVGTSTTNGNSLTIKAGDAFLSGTHLKGGNLKLSSGIGTLGGNIELLTSTPSVSSTTYNVPTVKATLFGNGNFSLGTNGVAKLNITASGTGGASEGLSIYDNGGNKNAYILDNGNAFVSNYFINTLPTLDNANDVVLVRNATTGKIDYRSASTLIPSLTTNYIGYGSGSNTVTGSPDFTWNNAAKVLYANGQGFFGGVTGGAKLNVTASGTGGASKIFSGYDSVGATEKVSIYDNGDISTKGNVSTDITKGFIIGDGTDGSWQMILSGADFLIQKKESGVWVTKSTISP